MHSPMIKFKFHFLAVGENALAFFPSTASPHKNILSIRSLWNTIQKFRKLIKTS